MSATSDIVSVGDALPTLASVEKANGLFDLLVTWASGSRAGKSEVIDVARQVYTFKVYAELRADPMLFARVLLNDDATAVIWPGNPDLEISADALEEMAEESMSNGGFADFIRRQGWTYEAAAAQLGISRRMVAYYCKEREIPRLLLLACKSFRQETKRGPAYVRN